MDWTQEAEYTVLCRAKRERQTIIHAERKTGNHSCSHSHLQPTENQELTEPEYLEITHTGKCQIGKITFS